MRRILVLVLLSCTLLGCVVRDRMVVSSPDYFLRDKKIAEQAIERVAVLPTAKDLVTEEVNLQLGRWTAFDLIERTDIDQVIG